MKNKEKIEAVLEKLNDGLYEREEIVAVTLLAALCGEHAFLLGPPGTAKSLIARRISQAFETDKYFEVLMNRFSAPEDIFGPISIRELKEDDRYVRKTKGYLPEADFAFLDEIWKAGPAILNTLLTIVNERKFHNGTKGDAKKGEEVSLNIMDTPLKSVVAASNETPPPNQGLEALYDRFVVRLHVAPSGEWDNFSKMPEASANTKVDMPSDLKITNEELEKWEKGIGEVRLSEDTLQIIKMIKTELAKDPRQPAKKQDKDKPVKDAAKDVYVSDRLWQKAAKLMKTAAFFCDRKETNLADALLLRHCLWSSDDNRERVIKCVEEAVKGFQFGAGDSVREDAELDEAKREVEINIEERIYHSEDVYDCKPVLVKKDKHFKFHVSGCSDYYGRGIQKFHLYVPVSKLQKSDEFNPVDKNGKAMPNFVCSFNGGDTCEIKSEGSYHLFSNENHVDSINFPVKTLHKRGEVFAKSFMISSYRNSVEAEVAKNEKRADHLDTQRIVVFQDDMNTPFVLSRDIERTVLAGMDEQRRAVTDRLEAYQEMMAILKKAEEEVKA